MTTTKTFKCNVRHIQGSEAERLCPVHGAKTQTNLSVPPAKGAKASLEALAARLVVADESENHPFKMPEGYGERGLYFPHAPLDADGFAAMIEYIDSHPEGLKNRSTRASIETYLAVCAPPGIIAQYTKLHSTPRHHMMAGKMVARGRSVEEVAEYLLEAGSSDLNRDLVNAFTIYVPDNRARRIELAKRPGLKKNQLANLHHAILNESSNIELIEACKQLPGLSGESAWKKLVSRATSPAEYAEMIIALKKREGQGQLKASAIFSALAFAGANRVQDGGIDELTQAVRRIQAFDGTWLDDQSAAIGIAEALTTISAPPASMVELVDWCIGMADGDKDALDDIKETLYASKLTQLGARFALSTSGNLDEFVDETLQKDWRSTFGLVRPRGKITSMSMPMRTIAMEAARWSHLNQHRAVLSEPIRRAFEDKMLPLSSDSHSSALWAQAFHDSQSIDTFTRMVAQKSEPGTLVGMAYEISRWENGATTPPPMPSTTKQISVSDFDPDVVVGDYVRLAKLAPSDSSVHVAMRLLETFGPNTLTVEHMEKLVPAIQVTDHDGYKKKAREFLEAMAANAE